MQFKVLGVPEHTHLQVGDILTPTFYQHNRHTGVWYIETAKRSYSFANEQVEKIYPDPGYFQMDTSQALSICAKKVNELLIEAQDVRHGKDPDHLQDRQVEILQFLQLIGCVLAIVREEL